MNCYNISFFIITIMVGWWLFDIYCTKTINKQLEAKEAIKRKKEEKIIEDGYEEEFEIERRTENEELERLRSSPSLIINENNDPKRRPPPNAVFEEQDRTNEDDALYMFGSMAAMGAFSHEPDVSRIDLGTEDSSEEDHDLYFEDEDNEHCYFGCTDLLGN
jgi:hypothetical protein